MSAPIGPGDWVECVDAAPRPEHYGVYLDAIRELRMGALYIVRGIAPAGSIYLVGLPSGAERIGFAHPLGWLVDRFRLIYSPREDLIATLLEPLPDTVQPVEA